MKKKLLAVAVALASVLVASGTGATVTGHGPLAADSVCEPPQMLLNKDKGAVMERVDEYLERNLTGDRPVYKADKLAETDWDILAAITKPGKVSITALVGENWTFFGPLKADTYDIVLVRDCADGDWRVVKFKRQAGPPAADASEPTSG